MVELSAFRALRYDTARLADMARVLAPPYDVIDDAQQAALYAQDPHNIVRIDLNRPESGDHPLSRYERAAQLLEQWQAEGVLGPDSVPAVYVLAQTFTGPDGVERTRTGFFSRARLVRFDEGSILPHERTLRGPKVDRLNLYRATRTNLSPIFGAYQDASGEVGALLASATAGTPAIDARLGHVRNRLWVVSDPGAVATLTRLFADKKLYIADGHHRYETGLAYRDERRAEATQRAGLAGTPSGPVEPDAGYEHILMFAAAVEDPGMVIFPTHRLVHSLAGFDAAKLTAALAPLFDVHDAPGEASAARAALAEHTNTNAFLAVLRGGAKKLLVAREGEAWRALSTLPAHPALRRLDVSVLHAVILEQVLGISHEAQATQANLRYSKDFAEAFGAAAADPQVDVAFLMNPTKIEEVIAVAESGEVMPQKSTFFYPKIPTGLVLCPLG